MSHGVNVRSAVIEPSPTFETEGHSFEAVGTRETDTARDRRVFVASLVPLHENVAGGHNSRRRDNRLNKVSTVEAGLVEVGTIRHRQREEALFRDTVIQACRHALNRNRDGDGGDINDIDKDVKVTRNANVGSTVDQWVLPKGDGGRGVAAETTDARLTEDVCDAVSNVRDVGRVGYIIRCCV
jgi:hypothetical protein